MFLCFFGHIGRHLGLQQSHTFATTRNRFLDLENGTFDILFVFLSYLGANIYIFFCFDGHIGRHLGK